MTDAQLQLQNALTTTFLANLAFLSEYDNELYQKVDELSRMIENNSYEEKYTLEFIEDNGDFDIYDLKNNIYLYGKKPKKINKMFIDQVDFSEKNSINSLEKALYNQISEVFDEKNISEKRKRLQDVDDAETILKFDVNKYKFIIDKNPKKKKLKKIEKFIFFGTLLGRHINPIVEKIDADLYFVCEKNLEIFRLSLFVNDYSHLAQKKGVIFSIMDKEEDLKKKANQFINLNPFSNYIIKLSSTNINVDEFIDVFLTSIVISKPTTFDYNRMLYTLMRNISEKVNNDDFLQLGDIQGDLLSTIKVLYIAGGPSFHENIQWIKENQNKFLIVTIGAVYKTLISYGIRVDVLITLDSSYKVFKDKQFSDEDLKSLKDSIVIYSSMTDKRFVEKFPKNRFCYDVITSYYSKKEMYPASSVGEKGLEILLKLGVKELYLLGLDLALNQKTGDSHGKTSDSITQKYDLDNKENIYDRSIFGLNTGLIKVKGNFIDEVFITVMFKSAIECLNRITAETNQDVRVYNLSAHGAFFENTIPLKIEQLKSLKEQKLEKELLINFLKDNSRKFLNKENINEILDEITFTKNSLNKLILYFTKPYETYDSFYRSMIPLINELMYKNEKVSFLPYIFRNYFQVIISYLNYKFNESKIKNEKKKVSEVRDTIKEQLEMLLSDYIYYLESMTRLN